MEIKDINILEFLKDAKFLGNGASKEAYLKNGIVYKIPRGSNRIVRSAEWYKKLHYPELGFDNLSTFADEVYCYDESMVWPLGQFVTEIIIWNVLKALEITKQVSLKNFARILNYYKDKNGIIVIEQEYTTPLPNDYHFGKILKQMKDLGKQLCDLTNIEIRDYREDNFGIGTDGIPKLFDFGLSSGNPLDYFSGYSDAYDYDYDSSY